MSVFDPNISVGQMVKWLFKVAFAYSVFYLFLGLLSLCGGLLLWWYVANFP